ncbi:MAG: hypothetical protein ACLR8J_01755 [Sutterella wadsworthensis]
MSNRLPRALLADIAAVIGSGDHASALMMLGDESGPEASAAVPPTAPSALRPSGTSTPPSAICALRLTSSSAA